MGIRNFIVGLAGNFIQAAVLAYLTNSARIALISFSIGLMLLLVAAIIGKRKVETAPPTLPPIHNENKQQFNPVFSPQNTVIVNAGNHDTDTEKAYEAVLAFLERTSRPGIAIKYFVESIAEATGLKESRVADALQRLFAEQHVYRTQIEGVGSDGSRTRWGYVYWYAHF